MAKKLKWGIIGCGRIAGCFAGDLPLTKNGELYAVAARSKDRADAFAKKYKAQVAYDSYEQLVTDPQVDVVYVATPHTFHMDGVMLAISAGKHVLCEKQITINAKQLKKLIAAAQKQGVFLMEGMWTRFFPATARVRRWIAEGRIGQVMGLEADFGVKFNAGPEHRIHDPHLGGGALLDLGVYPISFASMVYGRQPEKITSSVHFCETGVDDQAALVFQYDQGRTAMLGCCSRAVFKQEARIYGQLGMITVHENFYRPHSLTLTMKDRKPKTVEFPHPGHGFLFEAEHVGNCIRKKMLQSNIMPLGESLEIMQTMDTIRRSWKLKYPGE